MEDKRFTSHHEDMQNQLKERRKPEFSKGNLVTTTSILWMLSALIILYFAGKAAM